MRRHLSLLLATGFYIGLVRGAPGTYASLLTVLALGFGLVGPDSLLPVLLIVSVVGVAVSSEVERARATQDPQIVVIDEIAGQLLTFLALPLTAANLLAGFLLFRIFDVSKPYPIRKVERWRGGWGIMGDDLLAGLYANLLLQATGWVSGALIS